LRSRLSSPPSNENWNRPTTEDLATPSDLANALLDYIEDFYIPQRIRDSSCVITPCPPNRVKTTARMPPRTTPGPYGPIVSLRIASFTTGTAAANRPFALATVRSLVNLHLLTLQP
jgi:hypothetical protein